MTEEHAEARQGHRALPEEVEDVFRRFFTCELSTLSPDGTPMTWPVGALWQPEQQRFPSAPP